MILSSILVFFVLQPGMILHVTRGLDMNVVAGKQVILNCPVDGKKPQTSNKVFWKYENTDILKYTDGRVFKGDKSDKSEKYRFVDAENGNYSLTLSDPKEGQYTCHVEENELRSYDITVWEIKGPQQQYFLPGEPLTLSLEQHATVPKHTKVEVTWFSPRKVILSAKGPRWHPRNNNWKLQINNLSAEDDSGTWECRIPLEDGLKVSYNIMVIGFPNALDDEMFAVMNSNVTLSCPLNTNLLAQKEKLGNVLPSGEWMKGNMSLGKGDIHNNALTSSLVKEIPKVRLEDAGKYQCRFRFGNRLLDRFIQLVVMKVSGELSSGSLCCHISAPAPPTATLCWAHAEETSCSHGFLESPFCHSVATPGLWRCDLQVKNEVKISINYSVVKGEGTGLGLQAFPLAEVVPGVGLILLLFIIAAVFVPACRTISRKRQQVKRMAQAKQHLLAKRTCQCQRELTNDYYHD